MIAAALSTASRPDTAPAAPASSPVTGVCSPGSLGVARYCGRLAAALRAAGVDYSVCARPDPRRGLHLHLANSSRRPVLHALHAGRYVLTLHDVEPRARALGPLYRTVVYPYAVDRAWATVVHSRFAADLLLRRGGRPRRLDVIPHPATSFGTVDRGDARARLGLPDDRLLAVLPGVIKSTKLVREAVAAVASVSREWALLLAGPPRDREAVAAARRVGVHVLERPDDETYEAAVVAADAVLCLRSDSVGETNGPLLDALGAGRPVLASATGSIPEVAEDAAHYVRPTAASIAAGLRVLADEAERRRLSRLARARAEKLSWRSSAAAHAELFAEAFDA